MPLHEYMELGKFKSTIIPLQDRLLFQAHSMLGNNEDAEDAVQEVFLRLWNIRHQLDSHPNVPGYAMQALKNTCIDKLRQRKAVNPLNEVENLLPENHTPYTATAESNSIEIIRQIIDTLPSLQRSIILMRDVEGYELSEIATITGTQTSAVTVNLSRARKKVREKYMILNELTKQESNYEKYR